MNIAIFTNTTNAYIVIFVNAINTAVRWIKNNTIIKV